MERQESWALTLALVAPLGFPTSVDSISSEPHLVLPKPRAVLGSTCGALSLPSLSPRAPGCSPLSGAWSHRAWCIRALWSPVHGSGATFTGFQVSGPEPAEVFALTTIFRQGDGSIAFLSPQWGPESRTFLPLDLPPQGYPQAEHKWAMGQGTLFMLQDLKHLA